MWSWGYHQSSSSHGNKNSIVVRWKENSMGNESYTVAPSCLSLVSVIFSLKFKFKLIS